MARSMSENQTVSAANDIPDDEFLQYLNDGQDRIQSLISNTRGTQKIFVQQKIIQAVANQESYTIPDRLLFNKSIENIEFSYDSTLNNYNSLQKALIANKTTFASDYPSGYYCARGSFFPIPLLSSSSGSFRVMYERSIDDLDIRRAQVQSVSGLTSTTFTNMTLVGISGSGEPDESSTPANLTNIDYICVCDYDGNVTAYNIPVLSYDSSSNVLTPRSFAFQTGETIAAGSYVTFHKWSTTVSQLPDECEKYLLNYCVQAILHRDSSNDWNEQNEMLSKMEKEIVDQMKKQTGEVQYIPQLSETEWY